MSGRTQAIVIGASMGGLLAARALADFFEQVIIIERDAFPPIGEHRKGVPQGQHAHVLLLRGREMLEGLFPGLTADLIERGAVLMDRPEKELIWFDGGGYYARFSLTNEDSQLAALSLSRPLLEGYVRQRVLALPNVTAIEQADVLGLVSSERAGRVHGVRILRRTEGSAEETLDAGLVVDASGRGSHAPKWLEAMGYARPEEEEVTIHVGYSSRLYRRRVEQQDGVKVILIAPSPQVKRGGAMLAQEGERWIVTLIGYRGGYPPSDEKNFLLFAENLPAKDIYDVIKDAEPLSEIIPYRFKANLRRRYEKLTRFPEGFLVFGDALCSFNPIYGQGMSVVASEALDLQQELRHGTDKLWRRFFRRAAKTIDTPWKITVGSDLRFPEVEGKRTPGIRFINAYMERLQRAAHRDSMVARAFNDVVNLLAPPQSLMQPAILWRVLRENLFNGRPTRTST